MASVFESVFAGANNYSPVFVCYGSKAKNLARFTSRATILWCVAHTPVFFLGLIFPMPEVKCCSVSVSLKLIS